VIFPSNIIKPPSPQETEHRKKEKKGRKRKKEKKRGRGEGPQKVPEYLMLRNHSIIFPSIDFRKRLSRRDTDEWFHLSIAQYEVKNSTKAGN
jgi:hypothetical protein